MKVIDRLNEDRLGLSFEVFPPKTDAAYEDVMAATQAIAALKPDFLSVTYGAGGGTSRYTVEIASAVERAGVPALAHLTCVSSTREAVRRQIQAIREAGLENVMALRGDIPAELADADRSGWAYHHAVELVRELRQDAPELCIGAACYPEVHPESRDSREDIQHLRKKVDAGVDFLTTQMFFDNSELYSFLYRLREAGVTVPVLPGIMPITSAKQVERAIRLSGCLMPRRFLSLVDRFGSNPAAMKQAGIIYATDQIIDLYANGIRHVHVYTMNKPDVAASILNGLSAVLGRQA